MYTVKTKKSMSKKKLIDKMNLVELDGFLMASKNKVFKIGDSEIREIKVINKSIMPKTIFIVWSFNVKIIGAIIDKVVIEVESKINPILLNLEIIFCILLSENW